MLRPIDIDKHAAVTDGTGGSKPGASGERTHVDIVRVDVRVCVEIAVETEISVV